MTDIQGWQEEIFYTLNSNLMENIKEKVSKESPLLPYLENNKSLVEVRRPLKWDVYLTAHCEAKRISDIIGKVSTIVILILEIWKIF